MRPLFCSFCPVGLSPTPSPAPYPTSTTDDSEFACLLDIIYNIFILTATPLQGSPVSRPISTVSPLVGEQALPLKMAEWWKCVWKQD